MFTNKKTLLAMSIASVFALSGCSSDDDKNEVVPDPVDPPVEVVVPPEAPAELNAVVNGNIVDSSTLNILPSTVMFYENGVASTSLVDVNGDAVTSVTSEDGSFSFLLKEDADIETVTAVVMSDGYVQKSFSIDLTALNDGDVEVLLPLLSKSANGVAVEEVDSAVSGGSSASPITGGVSNGKATAAVTVPGGTILQDADGNPVTGSSVKLTVTAADTSSSAGAAITPEGLNIGSTTSAKKPVGVASVEMLDSNGVKIKKFSQPITVSMAIPADKGVSTGDMLTLVSQNEDTGVWTTESQQVEVKDLIADGSFYNASFMTDHLTFFAAATDVPKCSGPITFILNNSVQGASLRLSSDDVNSTLTKLNDENTTFTISGDTVSNLGIATDATAFVTVYNSAGTAVYISSEELALCEDGTGASVTVPNPAEETITLIDETLTINSVCSNDSSVTVPASGALVKYRASGTGKAFRKAPAVADAPGTYSLFNLVSDADNPVTYEVVATFSGELASLGRQNLAIDADGQNQSRDVTINCSTVTGS